MMDSRIETANCEHLADRWLVEQVGNGHRLELFGRRQVPEWTVWGNEVERDKFHQGVGELLDAEQVET
jgi:hypothetical protein